MRRYRIGFVSGVSVLVSGSLPAMLVNNQLPIMPLRYLLANPTLQRPGGWLRPGVNEIAINQDEAYLLRVSVRGATVVAVVRRPDDRHPYCVGQTVRCQFSDDDTAVLLSLRLVVTSGSHRLI